ncbi:Acyltransferase [Phocaeicola vulgatus]|uniref:Acyltransferase n=2 Tax=Phocaeicola vulgatus TaxID=821 RepID=A0A0P0LFR7_PHOVU|nr:Acyltransferase [Phocaeicola vulgatus]
MQLAQTYDWHISLYISIPLIFAVTIGLSLLSYYYFEKPVNRWVKRILNKQMFMEKQLSEKLPRVEA